LLQPPADTVVEAGDTLVLFGPADALSLVEARILR
jgi:K+/H+ antiporter YhaU regulatory subunit KhtT